MEDVLLQIAWAGHAMCMRYNSWTLRLTERLPIDRERIGAGRELDGEMSYQNLGERMDSDNTRQARLEMCGGGLRPAADTTGLDL